MKQIHKTFIRISGLAICLLACSLYSITLQERSLASIYQSSKVRFDPEIILDDNSTPNDIFFEGYEHTSAIAEDEQGNIYIADFAANHVKKFDAKGEFIKTLGIVAPSLVMKNNVVNAFCSLPSDDNKKPNIVIIVADDLGWGDVGYHGAEIDTPHIDQFVQQGMELNRFYVCPVCSPTRAGLLTGH